MSLQNMIVDHNSEQTFRDRLLNTLSSGTGLIHVRTSEVMRTLYSVRNTIILESGQYNEWDIRNGTRTFNHENIYHMDVKGDASPVIAVALQLIWDKYLWWMKDATSSDKEVDYVYTLVNPQYQLANNPAAFQSFMEMCYHLPESTVRVVFVTDDVPLHDMYASYFATIDFDRPGHSELVDRLRKTLTDYGDDDAIQLDEEDFPKIAVAGAGMVFQDFEYAVSSTLVECLYRGPNDESEDELTVTLDDFIKGVAKGKTEAIKKNDILELLPSGDMNDVGGMHYAKEWVAKRANCYSDEAIAFGIDHPKGMVNVGVPGSGKSLMAKAVGGVLGVPVVRLDFGKVFNSLVGSSEERIRRALRLVESMAPCVLFVDEIDKGLGGLGGSGDSGTSMRVFGTFLTWLQENDKPVFTMVTANNVDGLPPELLRRGRFDAIFATAMPNEFEREDVLEIHLRKRGHDIDYFSDDEIAGFLKATDECVPAEIESIVQDALVLAFNENMEDPALTMEHMLQARRTMVPLYISHKAPIQKMVDWANANATPASYSMKDTMEIMGRQRRGEKKISKVKARARRTRSRGKTGKGSVTPIGGKKRGGK